MRDPAPHRSAYVDHSVHALRRSGARVTKPRLAVLACLAATKRPLTARELLETLREDESDTDVDQATVYRILEAFVELGLVHRVGPDGGFVACDHLGCGAEMHVVTRCSTCARTAEIDMPPELMASVRRHVEATLGFAPGDHFLQMSGTCATCAGRRPE